MTTTAWTARVTVALSAAQIGLALLLWARLERRLRRPGWWAVVAGLNLTAMTVFLWHQSALIGVAVAARAAMRAPTGLTGPPDAAGWIGHRLLGLPVVAVALTALSSVMWRAESPARLSSGARRAGRRPSAGLRHPRRRRA